jgi:hypothetical protein
MSLEVWLAVPLGLAAAIEDLVRRRVSNCIPAAALAGGTLGQISQHSWAAIIGPLWATAYLGIRALLRFRSRASTLPLQDQPVDSIPYAPSMAMGVWLALLAKAGAMR